jgi:hypothetical protein
MTGERRTENRERRNHLNCRSTGSKEPCTKLLLENRPAHQSQVDLGCCMWSGCCSQRSIDDTITRLTRIVGAAMATTCWQLWMLLRLGDQHYAHPNNPNNGTFISSFESY